MKRKMIVSILSLMMALSLLLAGCGASSATQTTAAPAESTTAAAAEETTATPAELTKVTLQLKWLPQAQFMGYYVAAEKGYYAEEGLDVEIVPGGADIIPEQQVENGMADIGVTWVSSLVKYQAKGYTLKEVAQIFQKSGLLLVAKAASGITAPADLAGKTVANWYGGNEYEILALLEKYNLDLTPVQQDYTMDQLMQDKVDAASAMTYNEYGLMLEGGYAKDDLVTIDMNDEGVAMLEDCLFVNSEWAAANSDTLVKFLKASIKGWDYACANTEESGKLVSAVGQSVSEDHQVFMAEEVAKLVLPEGFDPAMIGEMDDAALAQTLELAAKYGSSDEADLTTLTASDIVDKTYWEAAIGG